MTETVFQRSTWGHILARPAFLAGAAIVTGYVAVALAAPLLYPGDLGGLPYDLHLLQTCGIAPGPTLRGPHPLGETQFMGYDVAAGLVVGSRWDLFLVATITGPSAALGTLAGLTAAGYGGKVDWLLMTVTDAVLAIPYFVFVILFVILLSPRVPTAWGPMLFVSAMVLVLWAPYSRGVLGEASRVVALPFVEASRAAGASLGRVLRRHILPNSLAPVLAQIPITVAMTLALVVGVLFVVTMANLQSAAFCGFGTAGSAVAPVVPVYNYPEWGLILAAGSVDWAPAPGTNFLSGPWWGFVIPALWIALFGIGVILLCDGLGTGISARSRTG